MRVGNLEANVIGRWSVNYFGGGGGVPKAPKPAKQEPMPAMPAAPAPVEVPQPQPIAPAATQSRLEQEQAAEQQRQDAARRNGLRKTLLAGETGGYVNPATGGTRQSLLG